MTFAFDAGATGSTGPWLVWSARPTHDGAVPARSWYIREESGKTPADLSKGMVLDIFAMKTGWQRGEGVRGVAPEWKFGTSPAALPPQPGDDWKKGLQVPVLLKTGQKATWEQANAGAWNAFAAIAPAIAEGSAANPGKLPVVAHVGATEATYGKGSTVIPTLEVKGWIDRPAALMENGGVAAMPAAEPPKPAPQAAPAAQPAASFDEVPF
jgi:hypothetical protein